VIVTNTIEYSFPAKTTTLAASTRYDWAAITLDIAETGSRSFRSVMLQVTGRDAQAATATRGSLTAQTLGVKVDAAAFTDVTSTATLADTGEQQGFVAQADVTSHFSTNFTGSSHSVQVGFQFTQTGTNPLILINLCAKLIITYDFDDSTSSNPTRTKTVRIPIESAGALQTATLTEIGTDQVPNLSTFCPEASKSFKDIFFEIWTNEGNTGTVDISLCLALDAEAEAADGLHEMANGIGTAYPYIWKRTDMSTSATHAFKARSTTTSYFSCLGAILTVTYTYSETNSSTILNSLLIPFGDEIFGHTTGATADQDEMVAVKDIWIPEPATVALAQSAVLMTGGGSGQLQIKAGSQSARAYTPTGNTGPSGNGLAIHRIDSGGEQGAGMTLARGKNTVVLKVRTTNNTSAYVGSPALLLNYTSGKSSLGSARHSKTVVLHAISSLASQTLLTASSSPSVAETTYWLHGFGFQRYFSDPGPTLAQGPIRLEVNSGELGGDGWVSRMVTTSTSTEIGFFLSFVDFTDSFNHSSVDPSGKMEFSATRRIQLPILVTGAVRAVYLRHLISYHSLTWTVSGTVSGYTGDGSGITIDIFRASDEQRVGSVTTSAGGGYSLTWFDDTASVYAVARQDSTHVGRSDDGVAS
jgi:hypothetical protein